MELKFHALLTSRHRKWPGTRDVFRGERVTVLNYFCFVFTIRRGAGVELAVHRENVGRHVFNQRVSASRFDFDGVIIHLSQRDQRFKNPFKIRRFFQTIERPYHIIRGKIIARVELHAFAQSETHGFVIHTLPRFGQTRFKFHFLCKANKWIKDHVRQLQSTA
ncbi:Uncharacterised protein [Vibrio cholerae]|uniref:Uncharacterized protein n=1 Tax=Vibrio cholerae TaxID=666 RepID=A0A655P410_VIBCL|nr:Uncharacterised protein [Vibrio cholerae]